MVKRHVRKTFSDEDVKILYEARERREEALSSPANPNPVTRGQWQLTVELTQQLNNATFQQMMKGARCDHNKSGLGFGAKPVKKTTRSTVERQAVIKAFETQAAETVYEESHLGTFD